ncbi:MAG: hypothetical protein HQ504_03545 [Rhodospirillaceae bacterium]|nr:hypothetical protein [Rhodospirillaceae bacterium]
MAQASFAGPFSDLSTSSTVQVLQVEASQPVTVPGGAWLLTADFAPQGPDLLLTGSDGNQILVRDFFSQGTLPDLMTDGGGTGVNGGELIFGGLGNDIINVTVATNGSVFVGGGGTDTLSYAALGTSAITYNVTASSIGAVRGSYNDSISGMEVLTGSNTQNNTFNFTGTTTTNPLTTVNGGGSNAQDTFNIQAGATVSASINGGASTNGTDLINSFTTGMSNDILHVNSAGLNGAGGASTITQVASRASDTALSTNDSVVIFANTWFTGVDSTAGLSTQIATFLGFLGTNANINLLPSLAASDKMIFVVDDTTAANDVSVWHWSDTDSGGDIDANEITDLATIDNIDISTLVAGNFA